jgi:hypothetical protein
MRDRALVPLEVLSDVTAHAGEDGTAMTVEHHRR